MVVYNFIFDLLWTGRGSSVSSVGSVGFRKMYKTTVKFSLCVATGNRIALVQIVAKVLRGMKAVKYLPPT